MEAFLICLLSYCKTMHFFFFDKVRLLNINLKRKGLIAIHEMHPEHSGSKELQKDFFP